MNLLSSIRLVAVIVAVAVSDGFDPRAANATSPVPQPEWAATLSRILQTDRAASSVQSVIFGAWIGTTPILTTAIGESLDGVPATTDMHIRPGIVQTEALDVILLKLVDERRVKLRAPLSTWFPNLPHAKDVTLQMLGNNRSGYGDYLADPGLIKQLNGNPFTSFTADQLIALGMNQMASPPGTRFVYSHTNAVLLGAALQRITGKSVATLIAQDVIGPLNLAQTAIPASADVPVPAQHLFVRERGLYEDSTYWDPSWASYSGTITSTVHDVAVMQRAFGSGALISKAGLAALLAPTNADSPPQTKSFYFGMGVIVGNTWVLQRAQVDGSDVVMAYLPERDLTIVVSTALGFASPPEKSGYAVLFFRDTAAYLAPERPIPSRFFD